MRQNQYTYLYVLTAVCVATGAASGLISPTLNVGVVNLFLEQFSRELPAGSHAVLVWDGAGYHTGGGLVVPANVSLIQLVPYSPELNPVENLWHYLREPLLVVAGLPGLRGVGGGGDGGLACGLPGAGVGPIHLRRSIRQRPRMKFLGTVLTRRWGGQRLPAPLDGAVNRPGGEHPHLVVATGFSTHHFIRLLRFSEHLEMPRCRMRLAADPRVFPLASPRSAGRRKRT